MASLPNGVKLRRTWPQRLFLTCNIALCLSCFVVAAGLFYLKDKATSIQHLRLSHVLDGPGRSGNIAGAAGADGPAPGEPINILLVGVDSADGLAEDDPLRVQREEEDIGGGRSDTMMVVRLMPAEGRVAVTSFPRDLWVQLAGFHYDKINAAMYYGGPELLIATIEENFGIPLHHYAQVDFAQFGSLVDIVDGVKVYFDAPVRDVWTGLEIPEPGCVTLRGAQALAYARSRHYERYDAEEEAWVPEAASDLGRIVRQQQFIRDALGRAVAKGARNPFTLNRLVDAGLDSVQLDDGLRAEQLVGLAMQFRSFDPNTLESYELNVSFGWEGEVSVLRLRPEAEAVLAVFRGDAVVGPDPADVGVRVLNGTGRPDEGADTGDALAEVGFDVGAVGDAEVQGAPRTVVRFGPEQRAGAELVARHLLAGADLVEDPDLSDGLVEVITGLDYEGVSDEPGPAALAVSPPTTTVTQPAPTSSAAAPAPTLSPAPPGTGSESDRCR
ncbi:MAG: LCP family protein [Acidimicrobiales bacterium]